MKKLLLPLLLVFIGLSIPIVEAAPKSALASKEKSGHHQVGLTWSVFRDKTVEGVTNYIKDNVGNVYRLVPGGPSLPFKVSKETIQAHAQRHGWKLVPVPGPKGASLAKGLGASWEVFKLGEDVYNAYTGEEEVKTAQNRVVAAEVGVGIGHMISLVPGAGVGTAMLAGWAGNNVKQAVFEALEAWDAHIEATEVGKAWKANDLRLAREKRAQIKEALKNNDFEKAVKLNRGLNAFTEERRLGIEGMGQLNEITWKLQDKIYAAAREEKARQALDTVAQRAEYKRIQLQWRADWEEKAREDATREALFSVRIIAARTNVAPGEQVPVGIVLNGGRPPYQLLA